MNFVKKEKHGSITIEGPVIENTINSLIGDIIDYQPSFIKIKKDENDDYIVYLEFKSIPSSESVKLINMLSLSLQKNITANLGIISPKIYLVATS
ncbi:MAG: hypothetical protein LBM76_01525 [Mycoplasmataceae bacterium]|jgi:hypothetical protein|nr:hypothetical protein [Mycoplasmataceae bacterium]